MHPSKVVSLICFFSLYDHIVLTVNTIHADDLAPAYRRQAIISQYFDQSRVAKYIIKYNFIDGLLQDSNISSATTLETLQSYTKQSISASPKTKIAFK